VSSAKPATLTSIASAPSWWINQPPIGFTAAAAQQLAVMVPVDFDDLDERVFVQRQHLLSLAIAVRRHRPTVGLMHANVVSRN